MIICVFELGLVAIHQRGSVRGEGMGDMVGPQWTLTHDVGLSDVTQVTDHLKIQDRVL